MTLTSGAFVGAAVGAGAEVLLVDGTAVGAAVVGAGPPVSPVDGIGVAVADEPHAKMAASRRARGPRIINLGFFNQ